VDSELHYMADMKRLWIAAGCSLLLLGGAAVAGWAQSAKDDIKDAGHDTKQAAKDTGRATKQASAKTAKKVKTGTKKAVNKGASKTEDGAARVKQKSGS
jgi:gas vesicle protein